MRLSALGSWLSAFATRMLADPEFRFREF